MLKKLKILFFMLRDIFILLFGFLAYKFKFNTPYFKRTSQKTNIALVNTFCRTKGKSNDLFNSIISSVDKSISFPSANGILGSLTEVDIQKITQALDKDGYYILPNKLPEDLCERLIELAKTEKCDLSFSDNDLTTQKRIVRKDYYDKQNPQATRYLLNSEICINNSSVQQILSDFSILSIAQSYLRASPKFDILGMWWNTNFSKTPQKETAEFFHFDMDRPKWLKFFIYLTDVTDENGPHQFVRGSHRTGGIPKQILNQGYARITDEEVNLLYKPENIIKFVAPKGTIIAEDTRGLHKATKILNGDRLMLQLQYSNTLFGTITPHASLNEIKCKNLQYIYENHPDILALYLANTNNIGIKLNLEAQPEK